MATATGTVSQIFTSVGQAVAKDAPLIAIRTKPAKTNPTDVFPTGPEIVVAAPVAGVVTQVGVEVGQAVKAAPPATATRAASIADPASVWLVAEIGENDARPLKPGQAVDVRPTALAGRVLKGKLTSVSPVDPATMRAAARIVVENPDGALELSAFGFTRILRS
jgi:multidrug resistance efflux pump